MSFSENEIIEQLALTRAASTSLALATSEKKNEILDLADDPNEEKSSVFL